MRAGKLTASQGVLEGLLETQELEDRQVDGGVETESALVGAESRVELDTEGAVDLHGSGIILPGDAEGDDTLGDRDDGEGCSQFGADLKELGRLEGGDELWDSMSAGSWTHHCGRTNPGRPARTRARKEGSTW